MWKGWDYENPALVRRAKEQLERRADTAHYFVTEVAPLGFWYDGRGLFRPQFQTWEASSAREPKGE